MKKHLLCNYAESFNAYFLFGFLLMLPMLSWGNGPSSENPNTFCLNTATVQETTEGQCAVPNDVFSLRKWDNLDVDENWNEGGENLVYIKVSGDVCCGETYVNPKAGNNCNFDLIQGPKCNSTSGDCTNACKIEDIGFYLPGLCGPLETCPIDPNIPTNICIGEHEISFQGWKDLGSGETAWFYKVIDKGCGAQNAISHLTFAMNDCGSCCAISCVASNNGPVCDGSSVTLSATVSDANGSVDYEWFAPNGTPIPNSNSASITVTPSVSGFYTVEVTDASGCGSDCETEVIVNAKPTCTATPSPVSCNGGSDGSITVSGSGGTSPYEYSLNGGVFQNSGTFSGLSEGSYTITVQDMNGCTSTCSTTINEPPLLTCSITSTDDVDCNGGSDGSITVSGSGGTSPYEYSLNGGVFQNSGTFSGLSEGSYTITVQDMNGCTSTCSTTINEPPLLTCSITSTDDVDCNGGSDGSITASGSGGTSPYEYSLNGGIFQNSGTFSGLSEGSYTITVQDMNGCTSTCSTTINEPPLLTCSITSTDDVDCNGGSDGSITVSGSGGTSPYEYSLNGGVFQNSGTFSGLSEGSYTITVQDMNGCTSTCSTTINEPPLLTCSITSTDDVDCNGGSDGSITASGSGGTSPYEYSLNGGIFQNSGTFSGLSEGSYTITVQDMNGCTSTCSTTINEPPLLTCSITSTDDVDCNGGSDGSITASGSGGTSPYEYSLNGGVFQNSGTFSGLSEGSYTITVQDMNGCTSTCDATIYEPSALTCTAYGTDVSCNSGLDGSISVSGLGGTPFPAPDLYRYSLDGISFQTAGSFTGLLAGSYTITVKDANGCMSTCTAQVNEPPLLTCTAYPTPISCFGDNDGKISVTPLGGTPGYQYSIDGGTNYQNENLFENLSAGDYTITVKDANGCLTTCDATVQAPGDPVSCHVEVSDYDDCDGATVALEVVGSGGTTPYMYRLGNGPYQTSPIFMNLQAGFFTFTVKDASGCTSTCTYEVNEECGTSWARLDGVSLCFDEVGCKNNNMPWGFTTPLTLGSYTFDILEGAPGLCGSNGSKGDLVGTVEVVYNVGQAPQFNFNMTTHYLKIVHVYVGCDPLPTRRNGRCTSAPGQFDCHYPAYGSTNPSFMYCEDYCSNSNEGDQIWVAIHAETCSLDCSDNGSYTGDGDEGGFFGRESLDSDRRFQMMPNPAVDEVLFDFREVPSEKQLSLSLVNQFGEVVYQQYFRSNDRGRHRVNLSNLPAGLYFAAVRIDTRFYTEKLVVIRR